MTLPSWPEHTRKQRQFRVLHNLACQQQQTHSSDNDAIYIGPMKHTRCSVLISGRLLFSLSGSRKQST